MKPIKSAILLAAFCLVSLACMTIGCAPSNVTTTKFDPATGKVAEITSNTKGGTDAASMAAAAEMARAAAELAASIKMGAK